MKEENSDIITITTTQEELNQYIKAKGTKKSDVILEIGRDFPWNEIVNHVFRVLDFDRNGTTLDKNFHIKAKSFFKPYGYLLAESPIMNARIKFPIIHKDDFYLASSVLDKPEFAKLIDSEELLVTYSPKVLRTKGLSGSPHHVLHYLITPKGTIDNYYSFNNNIHRGNPEPQKLFGQFVYEGEIRVRVSPDL